MRAPARRPTIAALLLLGWTVAACNTLGSLEAGYQEPAQDARAPGHRGVTVEAHYGLGPDDMPVGVEGMLRTKQGSHLGQYAAGVGAYAFTPPEVVGVFGRVGVNLLQLELQSGEFSFGSGSPWADLGIYFCPDLIGGGHVTEPLRDLGGLIFTVKGSVGYDLRFTDRVPDTASWALLVGIGFVGYSGL